MEPYQHEQSIGVDLDKSRQPGVSRFRRPESWPNSRFPMPRQPGIPAAMQTYKGMPRQTPVFSTALPPRGLPGAVRRLAYRYPDHRATRWLLLLAGDRIESMGKRLPRVAMLALPAAVGVLGVQMLAPKKSTFRIIRFIT